jgi:hypothetical protein
MDGVQMTQQSISASSKYWDGKPIALTETTQNNMKKKAYMLDAETLFSQYQLEGDDAVNAAKQSNVTEEQLVSNPNSYTFLAISAITDLEANASKDSRVNAVVNLTKLGYTNVYDSNSQNFIDPPDEPVEEKPEAPVQAPEPEPETRYKYLRRNRPVQQEQSVQQYAQPEEQPQEEGPSPQATLSGAAKFIPNKVRQYLPQSNPNRMSPARMSPQPQAYVKPRSTLPPPRTNPSVRTAPQRTQPAQRATVQQAPAQPRPLLNAGVAAKLGGRGINPVSQGKPSTVQRITPRAKFGLGVRR